MITLGLTGMSGSGKSFVANLFSEFGIPSINADTVVHRLYADKNECTVKLKSVFGEGILNPDHSINRKALGKIVFSDRAKLALLNETVHPLVINEMRVMIENAKEQGKKAVILDAPQLFESHLDADCDYIIAVIADEETRLQRIAMRDGITIDAAKIRLANQHPNIFFKEHSDFCIENSRGADLKTQIIGILREIGLTYE